MADQKAVTTDELLKFILESKMLSRDLREIQERAQKDDLEPSDYEVMSLAYLTRLEHLANSGYRLRESMYPKQDKVAAAIREHIKRPREM